jgi:hypothetical protein
VIGWIIMYCLGLFITAGIGTLMLFVPPSDEDAEKRRGAKLVILSPVWPVLAVTGIAFVWRKAKATLSKESEA